MSIRKIFFMALLVGASVPVSGLAQPNTFRRPVSKRDAVMVVDAKSPQPQDGGTIRCAHGQRVGVWIESQDAVTVRGMIIEDCEVGVVVGQTPPGGNTGQQGMQAPGAAHAVNAVTVRRALVSVWWLGAGGSLTDSIIGDAQYGIVLSGNGVRVKRNQISNISKDGFLLIGDWNTIIGNSIDGAGRHGLNVVGAVPTTSREVVILGLHDTAVGNTIQENTITNSGRLDLRQWPRLCNQTTNTYLNNTAAKSNMPCPDIPEE